MSEFNLSEKINVVAELYHKITKQPDDAEVICISDVKEFIRLFKQELDNKNKGSSTISKHRVIRIMDDIKNEIDNAQEDCANLDWISKEQALKIINKHLGKDLKWKKKLIVRK